MTRIVWGSSLDTRAEEINTITTSRQRIAERDAARSAYLKARHDAVMTFAKKQVAKQVAGAKLNDHEDRLNNLEMEPAAEEQVDEDWTPPPLASETIEAGSAVAAVAGAFGLKSWDTDTGEVEVETGDGEHHGYDDTDYYTPGTLTETISTSGTQYLWVEFDYNAGSPTASLDSGASKPTNTATVMKKLLYQFSDGVPVFDYRSNVVLPAWGTPLT